MEQSTASSGQFYLVAMVEANISLIMPFVRVSASLNIASDMMRSNLTSPTTTLKLHIESYLSRWMTQSTGSSGPLYLATVV